jgi:hypothetical protein
MWGDPALCDGAGLSRDLGILLICTLLFATNTLRDFRPSKLGKANTAMQILGVLTVMTARWFRAGLESRRKRAAVGDRGAGAGIGRGVCVDCGAEGEYTADDALSAVAVPGSCG